MGDKFACSITIDADCILANLLQSREEVTVRELNEIRGNIERLVPSAYVDVTKNCVAWAVNQHPEMFNWTDQVIRRCREWSQRYVDEFFNWRIPSDVRSSVLQAMVERAAKANRAMGDTTKRVRVTHSHAGGMSECAAMYGTPRPVFRCSKCKRLRGWCQGADGYVCDVCARKALR